MTTDKTEITCIVTIHGIGFQQPPEKGVDGYADDLHAHLCAELNQDGNVLLSDDPDRDLGKHTRERKNVPVPIYVSSVWLNESGVPRREEGLMRLGSWTGHDRTAITYNRSEKPNQALVKGDARIAHVALVYSELEGKGPQPVADIVAAGEALIYGRHYTNFKGLLKIVIRDTKPLLPSIWAKIKSIGEPTYEPALTPSLRVRQDKSYRHPYHHIGATRYPSGFKAILRQLENDVAAYVCHNGVRQRIRSFVLDALFRLAFRDDVLKIILNTHSNGTLIALDVLQELPPIASSKISAIITAGSPIRKYVDFFEWGKQLAVSPMLVKNWFNFYDEKDIVADPLIGIYQTFDLAEGEIEPINIFNKPVDNVSHSQGGGLQAHNYWDNKQDFIPKVAEIVKCVHTNTQIPIDAEEASSISPARKKRRNRLLRYLIG